MTLASTTGPRLVSPDEASPAVVSFPFAFAASMIFIAGLVAFVSGIIVVNGWLAAAGFVVALVGGLLYGWGVGD